MDENNPLREAAQAVADTSPGNYGFLAKWQRLRIVLDEIAAQPAPAAPLDPQAIESRARELAGENHAHGAIPAHFWRAAIEEAIR